MRLKWEVLSSVPPANESNSSSNYLGTLGKLRPPRSSSAAGGVKGAAPTHAQEKMCRGGRKPTQDINPGVQAHLHITAITK